MAKKKRDKDNDRRVIDTLFAVPIGAEDAFIYGPENIDEFVGDPLLIDDGPVLEEKALSAPKDFVVFSQTIRRVPGGHGLRVIDVVVKFPAVDGATSYEFQVDKL